MNNSKSAIVFPIEDKFPSERANWVAAPPYKIIVKGKMKL